MIAGIDWVVQHRNDGDLNIRVINLSYGTDGTQDYRSRSTGPSRRERLGARHRRRRRFRQRRLEQRHGRHDQPAFDPYVIAVSASEATDWGMTIPKWASAGDYFSIDENGCRVNYWQDGFTGRLPDVVAPGSHIDSLRVPGSRVDVEHPEGFVTDTRLPR